MIKRVTNDVWKVVASSNVYFLDIEEKILIDTGDRADRHVMEQFLSKVVELDKVTKVIFTHLHHDHIGNFDLFPKAKFYASQAEIDDFKNNGLATVLDRDILEKFVAELNPIESSEGLEIIETPGHTRGSICVWYPKEKILFTGDSAFKNGYGRTDLPTSVPEQMTQSIMKLLEYPYKIMCPGHDY
jgi:hydroxyacylglutathione hydrolase